MSDFSQADEFPDAAGLVFPVDYENVDHMTVGQLTLLEVFYGLPTDGVRV